MPQSMEQGGMTYYLMYDQVGSLRGIADDVGNIIKRVDYDSFGNIISDDNPGFRVPFGFAGGLYDSYTGLVRFGARDYDPTIGRWTAKDPIDFAGGDLNLYGYVGNSPMNFADPLGLIILYCNRGAKGPLGWAGFNHGYLWDTETENYYGMGGSEEKGPKSDTCDEVSGTEGLEGTILNDLWERSEEPWRPWSNCHTAIDDVLNAYGLIDHPEPPGGLWGPIPD